MRLLRYSASKNIVPVNKISILRGYDGKLLGIHVRRGMRCYSWMWRLYK